MDRKETLVSFFTNMLAVILGIVITFSIQAMIDRAQDRRDVKAALALIRTELAANREDIGTMRELLEQERRSAAYIVNNRASLKDCPADSVRYHCGIVNSELSITLSHDALELLKMSSLFQKIGSNDLSMKIIRAYDACTFAAATLNGRISDRNEQLQDLIDEQLTDQHTSDWIVIISRLVQTEKGLYFFRQLTSPSATGMFDELSEIDEALAAIDAVLPPENN